MGAGDLGLGWKGLTDRFEVGPKVALADVVWDAEDEGGDDVGPEADRLGVGLFWGEMPFVQTHKHTGGQSRELHTRALASHEMSRLRTPTTGRQGKRC